MACKNSIQSNTIENDILWVSGIKVECDNDQNLQCLQTQFLETPFIDKWIPWKDSIIDFHPEIGYMYKLKVKTSTITKKERVKYKEVVKHQLIDVLEKKQDPAVVLYDIWGLYSMNGEVLNTSFSRPRMELNLSNHKLSGRAFCNQMSGHFQTLNNTIKFSKIATTKLACMNLEYENKFIKLLEHTTTFKRGKNLIKFYNSDGKEVLAFKKLD